jgi:HK97 family phage major capsid protein
MTQDTSRPDHSPVAETRAAVLDLVRGFQDFQTRIEAKMKAADERLATLDRRAAALRPALATATETASPHRKALGTYLRSGDESGLAGVGVETKAITGASPTEGGVLIDPQTSGRIESIRRGAGALRSVATVVQVQAGVYEALMERADIATAWVSESGPIAADSAPVFERISIPLHELSAAPRASARLLEDSAFDVESWLADTIADRFARAENAAFISGTGVDMPAGILSHPKVPYTAAAWGQIGYLTTGVPGGFEAEDPVNSLVDLVYALGTRYRGNGTFVMNSRTAGMIRKMKDTDGRFMWTEALCAGQPALLLGYPVLTIEEMPDVAPDAFAIAFGDFRAGYTIAERPDLRILRDPYSVKPHVQFYASMRVGGDVTDFSAIRLLKFGTA